MDFDTQQNRECLINFFPNLGSDDKFKVNSPLTDVYNCIAFAMGLTDRWVDIFAYPGHWWPPIEERSENKDSLVKAFEYMGFEICDNADVEDGYDKVVLFCKDEKWTHAARIVANGVEHSKFGKGWDAFHGGNNIFHGSDYGDEYAYMKRSIAKRDMSAKLTSCIGQIRVVA